MRCPAPRRHHADARGTPGLDRKEAPVLLETAAYLYPWDVVGDPAAAELYAGLGLHHVTLAAVYHATRALTPRHPRHRVVVAEHSAAYYPLSTDRWDGTLLYPPGAEWTGGTDAFGVATAALLAAGLPVHAWVVVNHVDLPGPPASTRTSCAGGSGPRWTRCSPARARWRSRRTPPSRRTRSPRSTRCSVASCPRRSGLPATGSSTGTARLSWAGSASSDRIS